MESVTRGFMINPKIKEAKDKQLKEHKGSKKKSTKSKLMKVYEQDTKIIYVDYESMTLVELKAA